MNTSKNPKRKTLVIQAITNQIIILLVIFIVLLAIDYTTRYEI
jgi:hypothetical protein